MTPHRMAERGITTHVLPSTSSASEVQATGADAVFSPTARATRPPLTSRWPRFGNCWTVAFRRLASASAIKSSAGRSVSEPTSSATGTAASTSRCSTEATGEVEITAHNHGFAVDAPIDRRTSTDFGEVEVSHVALNDGVVEGLRGLELPAFSVQYHPEAAAGPHDAGYLFDRFAELLEGDSE